MTENQLITGTDFITVATRDYDAAAEFYGAHPIELRVDDVAAARAELESRGIEFEADTLDSGVCHQAFFADPDGNALAIHHRYAPPGVGPGGAGG